MSTQRSSCKCIYMYMYSRCTTDKGLCSGLWLVLATDFHPLSALVAGELTGLHV